MNVRVDAKFPEGNVAAVRMQQDASIAYIYFTANPCGRSEALWFYFRITNTAPDSPHPESLTLVLEFVSNLTGCDDPSHLYPVFRGEGQGWNRVRSGIVTKVGGNRSVSWTIPYPASSTEFAFCYPYGRSEIKTLLQKSKGYWSTEKIGISQSGRFIERISNRTDPSSLPGIYLIARQRAGETPGSWVLDGILQHFSRTNESRILIWSVPLADIGGIERGQYGRGDAYTDLDQAWESPPLRYEVRAMQSDLVAWQTHAKPCLVLDIQAANGTENKGVYCYLPRTDSPEPAIRDAEKWANVIHTALGSEYAAENFKCAREVHIQTCGMPLDEYVRQRMSISALTLCVPYASCGKTMLAPKQYREMGRRIARAILQRITT